MCFRGVWRGVTTGEMGVVGVMEAGGLGDIGRLREDTGRSLFSWYLRAIE